MALPQRLLQECKRHLTIWLVGGLFAAGLGISPEEWVANLLHSLNIPNFWGKIWSFSLDSHIALFAIGMMIIAIDRAWLYRFKDKLSIVVFYKTSGDRVVGCGIKDIKRPAAGRWNVNSLSKMLPAFVLLDNWDIGERSGITFRFFWFGRHRWLEGGTRRRPLLRPRVLIAVDEELVKLLDVSLFDDARSDNQFALYEGTIQNDLPEFLAA